MQTNGLLLRKYHEEINQSAITRVSVSVDGMEDSNDQIRGIGEKDLCMVPTRAVQPLFEWADLAKIDAERHEKALLLSATRENMQEPDIMVEIGNPENAKAVFGHFQSIGMYAQEIGWGRVQGVSDDPTSHREGSLFITTKPTMPWRTGSLQPGVEYEDEVGSRSTCLAVYAL